MVEFTRLRIVGFKSFVDPTEVAIAPGLTGIVGPNGCGKSNLVEALRWVMAESSAKQLRGDEMEDVIFAGAEGRPGRNHAEVSVLLDNAGRDAPPAFNEHAEIEVSRRIARGQGSAYRVNGREARARDVQVLFADSSTGAHSAAMVGQGQVANLINVKPTQRRSILEEAAGITGLHARRHEAELRLRAAEANLERLDDVIAALDEQLKGLKRQARQASRYRNISDLIRKAEAGVLYLKWRRASALQDDAATALTAAEALVGERAETAAVAAAARSRADEALPALRDASAKAAGAVQRLELAAEQLDAEERRNREATANVQRQREQIEGDLQREATLRADADASLARLDAERAELSDATAGEADALDTLIREIARLSDDASGSEAALAAVSEALAADEATQHAAQREIRQLDEALEKLTGRIAALTREQAALQAQRAANDERERATAALADAETGRSEARRSAEAAEAALKAAREDHGRTQERVQALRTERARLEAEAETLRRMLSAGGAARWAPVLDAIKVDRGFENALAAALGDDLQASCETGAPLTWTTVAAPDTAPALPEGCRPLGAVCRAPAVLRLRLSQIGLVEVAGEGAPTAQIAALAQGQRLVARDGRMWRWDGFRAAAGAPTAAAIRLEQRNQLEAVEARLVEHLDPVEAAEAAARAGAERLAEAECADQAGRQALRQADRAATEVQLRLGQAERREAEAGARLAALASALEDAGQREAETGVRRTELEAVLKGAEDLAARRQERDRLRAEVAERRTALVETRARHERTVREAEARARRLTRIGEESGAWRDRVADTAARVADLAARHDDALATLATLGEVPGEIVAKRAALAESRRTADAARADADDRLAEAESALRAAAAAARAAEAALAAAREERVRHEAGRDAASAALADAVHRIEERLECTPDALPARAELNAEDPTVNEPDTLHRFEERHLKLVREREGMGPVNLRAIEEAEELEQRIAGLEAERGDLVQAIARLRQAIGALNREGRARLVAAFDKVNAHFQSLFHQLFGGGRAYLELTGADDPLEAGLEIMASPPGKQLQSLSLLSGGERTLTALALIFAVFRTNPAPICVLDEVDAPLDDANVDRFCRLLDEMVRTLDTRFLLVTHHRLTMARMDRLYGVTMPERGVSQLVSVDLGVAERMRAA